MRPKQQQKARHDDLFRARLDQVINMKHALAVLAVKPRMGNAEVLEALYPLFLKRGRPECLRHYQVPYHRGARPSPLSRRQDDYHN